MSRADRERALYIHKLCRIKSDVLKNYPNLIDQNDEDNIVTNIDQRINEELESVDEDSSEYDESLDESPIVKENKPRTH